MSWETSRRLRSSTIDVARITAALDALAAEHPGVKAKVERVGVRELRCLIDLPTELVERARCVRAGNRRVG